MAMSLTSKAKPYKNGFDPFAENIYRVPHPDPHHRHHSDQDADCVDCSLRALERLFETSARADSIAAVIIEPVLGGGGFIVPSCTSFPSCGRSAIDMAFC